MKDDKFIFIFNFLSILNYFFLKGLTAHVDALSTEFFVFTILIQRQKN